MELNFCSATELLLRPIQIGDNGGPIVTSRRSILLRSPFIDFTRNCIYLGAFAQKPSDIDVHLRAIHLIAHHAAPATPLSEVNETDLSHVNAA